MNHLEWAKNRLRDTEAQEHLETRLENLIEEFFKGKSDYAIEKFIKSFVEALSLLENLLQKQRGIHPSQIKDNLIQLQMEGEKTAKKYAEVKDRLIAEINRQSRHFTIFLSEFSEQEKTNA